MNVSKLYRFIGVIVFLVFYAMSWAQLPDLSKANSNQLKRMLKQTIYYGDIYSSVDIMEALVLKEGTEENYWNLAEIFGGFVIAEICEALIQSTTSNHP